MANLPALRRGKFSHPFIAGRSCNKCGMTATTMDTFINIDYQLFEFFNAGISNAFFDSIMPIIREKKTWIPLYIILLGLLVYFYKKQSILIIIFAILAVVASDQFSSIFLKELIERPRPCVLPELQDSIRLIIDCSKAYSFPSSHASNHFAIAIFLGMVFKPKLKWILPVLVIWALVICFAQIYVGVHFPSDILGGIVIGICTGLLFYFLFKKTNHFIVKKR